MSIEIALGIVTISLLILNALHGSKINKLNRELEACNRRLENKTDDWKHDHVSTKVDRLQERYEALYKEIGELESKTLKDIDRAKQDVRKDIDIVCDQFHAFADELGYDVSKAPAKYKVTKRV